MLDEDLVRFFASKVKTGFYGDIRLIESEGLFLAVENGEFKNVSRLRDCGFGIRLMKDGIWGSASSNTLSKRAIVSALGSAESYLKAKLDSKIRFNIKPESNTVNLKPTWKEDLRKVDINKKSELVLELDNAARGKKIISTMSGYNELISQWMIGSNMGNLVSFYNSYPFLYVSAFVKDKNSVQSISKTIGGNCGFELFQSDAAQELGAGARKDAENLIGAKVVKGGKYDVVLDPSMTGVYTHEAFGHATEADAVLAGGSILEHKLDKKVGNDLITIVDDPTIPGAAGSFVYDQEGTKAVKRVLVENGTLKAYLNTLETSNRLGLSPNGAARSFNHTFNPIARMSNTFIKPGDFKKDIIEDIKDGISFYGFRYGYVDPATGKFMFKSQCGRKIKNGKLGEFVRDVSLTGLTLDVLNKIDAVGSNFALNPGDCGKGGQWVPVTSGGPTIRLREMVVGGQ
jgi:TldD protein